MSFAFSKTAGAKLSLRHKWVVPLDGLVRHPVPDPYNKGHAVVVIYAEKRRTYEVRYFKTASGEELWRKEVVNGGYGSPTFLSDLILVQTEFAGVEALRRDGTTAWRYTTASRVRSSFVADGDGLLFSSGSDLIALDATGAERMRLTTPRAFLFGRPERHGSGWLSLATVGTPRGSEVQLLKLSPDSSECWSVSIGLGEIASSDTSGFYLEGGRAYIGGPSTVCCVDVEAGEMCWEVPIVGIAHRHSCIGDGASIYYTTVDGHVGAIGYDGQPQWERMLSRQGVWASPSLLGDRIAVPCNGLLFVLDAATGATIQQAAVGQSPYSAVSFAEDGVAMIGGGDPPYWGLLVGFDVCSETAVSDPICTLTQPKQDVDPTRGLDLVLTIQADGKVSDVEVDFAPIGGLGVKSPDSEEGNRFIFSILPAQGYRWGCYALPVEFSAGGRRVRQTVALELDDPTPLPGRVLLKGFEQVRQEEEHWSGAALMAAMRTRLGDPVGQSDMRDMVDAVREHSGYLPFDTWRILARRALSTSAKRAADLPEFAR